MPEEKQPQLYKEQVTHGTPDFPLGFYEIFPDVKKPAIKHHWHEEIEILYFSQGTGTMNINMESFPFAGEAFFFVNSGGLHSMTAYGPCLESAILFHPRMLSFDTYDTSQSRLLQPLLKGALAFPRTLTPSHPAFAGFRSEYLATVEICQRSRQDISANIAAQLFIKAGLIKLLAILYSHDLLAACTQASYKEEILKTSLVYIRSHYQDKIYIRDLAEEASMNEQYYCRFFKECIGQSPIAYINEYRVRQALLLLRNTNMTVMDVSLHCGFSNFGNFLKAFKRHAGITPLKYRQAYRSTDITPPDHSDMS